MMVCYCTCDIPTAAGNRNALLTNRMWVFGLEARCATFLVRIVMPIQINSCRVSSRLKILHICFHYIQCRNSIELYFTCNSVSIFVCTIALTAANRIPSFKTICFTHVVKSIAWNVCRSHASPNWINVKKLTNMDEWVCCRTSVSLIRLSAYKCICSDQSKCIRIAMVVRQ